MPETLASFSRAVGFERVLADVEQHIGNVDHETSLALACIQDEIQLLDQAGAQFGFFSVRLALRPRAPVLLLLVH